MRLSFLFVLLVSTSVAVGQKGPVDFERDILPLFERSCFECHGTPRKNAQGNLRRPKAGLRLDGKAWILRGSDDGSIVAPKKPESSELFLRVSLPRDDPDLMPPKGDPLSKEERETVRRWIAEGASFGGWQGNLTSGASDAKAPRRSARGAGPARKELVDLARGLAPVSKAVRAQLSALGAVVENVDAEGKLLAVHFASHEARIGDKQVEALKSVRDNVVRLDLARTKITDRSLARIAAMPRLLRLDLTDTAISNSGLRKLKSAPRLRELVLCGTSIDEKAVKVIAAVKTLRSLYVWRTGISENALAELAVMMPATRVVGPPALPPPSAEGTDRPRRRRSK